MEGKFYISTEKMKEVPLDKICNNLEKGILSKATELVTTIGIKPTIGTLTDTEKNSTKYVLIERYDKQFSKLNCPLYIYELNEKNLSIKAEKVENLYNYLAENDQFLLVNNDDNDKWWYDIPFDNGDVIRDYFLNTMIESDNPERDIMNLLLYYPNEVTVINQLGLLMNKMSKTDFTNFTSKIYDEKDKMINHQLINEKVKEYSIKAKLKNLLSKKHIIHNKGVKV